MWVDRYLGPGQEPPWFQILEILDFMLRALIGTIGLLNSIPTFSGYGFELILPPAASHPQTHSNERPET